MSNEILSKSILKSIEEITNLAQAFDCDCLDKRTLIADYCNFIIRQIMNAKSLYGNQVKEVYGNLLDIKLICYTAESVEKQRKAINDSLLNIVGVVARLGGLEFVYPEEKSWDEDDALRTLINGCRVNPATYFSAVYWLREFGSKYLQIIIFEAYQTADSSGYSFDMAFNQALAHFDKVKDAYEEDNLHHESENHLDQFNHHLQ